jgi:hypothetical protein
LALLAENSGGWKRKSEIAAESSHSYKLIIDSLERRLQASEKFIKFWEPKLVKWDSLIEELHNAEFAPEDGSGHPQRPPGTIQSRAPESCKARETSRGDESL